MSARPTTGSIKMERFEDQKARRTISARNVSGGLIEIGSFVEVTGREAVTNVIEIDKPSGDSLRQVYITTERIQLDEIGSVSLDWHTWVNFTGTEPAIGDTVGTETDQFEASLDQSGFIVLDVDTEDSRVAVRPFSGAGVGVVLDPINFTFGETFVVPSFTPSIALFTSVDSSFTLDSGDTITEGAVFGVGIRTSINVIGPTGGTNVSLQITPRLVSEDGATVLFTFVSLTALLNVGPIPSGNSFLRADFNFHSASIIGPLSEPATKFRYNLKFTSQVGLAGSATIATARTTNFFPVNPKAIYIASV